MTITDMLKSTNKRVGKGAHSYGDLVDYYDECVDLINVELNLELPLVSSVYKNDFGTKTAAELLLTYNTNSLDNQYTRIPDAFIRNCLCYYAAYKMLQEQDEDPEVYTPKQYHALEWQQRLRALFANHTLHDTEAISFNGDVDELEGVDSEDDTALGYYNTPGLW